MFSISANKRSWKAYFITLAIENDKANTACSNYMKVSEIGKDKIETINRMTNDKGDSLLLYFSNISKTIRVIHSPSSLGNNNLNPETLVVALDGFDDSAIPVIFDPETLFQETSLDAPTLTRLLAVDTADDLTLVEAPTNNATKFESLPFVIIPPFLWETLISETDKSPENIFLATKRRMSTFEEDNKDDDKLKDATKECRFLLLFLWAATKDLLPHLTISAPGDEKKVWDWAKTRHTLCLPAKQQALPPPQDSSSISRALESSLSRFPEMISSSFINEESKKKGFEKLDSAAKNLILNASAPNEEIAAGAPSNECAKFYKSSTIGSANQCFTKALRNNYNCSNLDVAKGVIVNLFNGNFLRSFDESPSNFSPFSFPKRNIMGSDGRYSSDREDLFLQLKENTGKGLSNEDVNSLLKQSVKIPTTIEALRFNIVNLTAASKFFFSTYSILPQELDRIHDHIVQNYTIYEALQYNDKRFTAKFLFAIDTRIQLWLGMCETEQNREDVNDKLIIFDDLLQEIVLRTFNIALPPSFKNLFESDKPSQAADLTSNPKKKRKAADDDQQKITNSGKIEAWCIDFDTFKTKFRDSEALKQRPTFGEGKICHRFHSKGYCFGNCFHKDSHVPSKSLPDDKKTEYKNWVNSTLENSE